MVKFNKELNRRKFHALCARATFKFRIKDNFTGLDIRGFKYLLNRRTRLYKKVEGHLGKNATALLFDGADILTLENFLYECKAKSSFIFHMKERINAMKLKE